MIPTYAPSLKPTMQPGQTIKNSDVFNPDNNLMNALEYGPMMNVKNNIIAGQNPTSYWNHSPGFERPDIREEGPFPVQGNIGSLMKEEAEDQYKMCSPMVDKTVIPSVGSSPNCSGVFRADLYTKINTCGAECEVKYPESYGDKDFGYPKDMPWNMKTSNAHQVHAYMNLRAGLPGQGPENNLGCYEWLPRVTPDKASNSCILNEEPIFEQVGAWNKLGLYSNIEKVSYR